MATIKFSHEYEKMLDDMENHQYDTTLLEVFKTEFKDLSEGFKAYDTWIKGEPMFNPNSYYPLPKTMLIVLLLKTDRFLWTTVRRWTKEKEEYYRGLRGKNVKTEIRQ